MRTPWMLFVALIAGAMIGYVDSRPHWDDTGITAGAIFVACAVWAAVEMRHPWLGALAVGFCVFLAGVIVSGSYGAALAFVPALVGAYSGWAVGRAVRSSPQSN